MTSQVLALRGHLIVEQVTCAVMEATGDYWKPFYYLLEDAGFEVIGRRTSSSAGFQKAFGAVEACNFGIHRLLDSLAHEQAFDPGHWRIEGEGDFSGGPGVAERVVTTGAHRPGNSVESNMLVRLVGGHLDVCADRSSGGPVHPLPVPSPHAKFALTLDLLNPGAPFQVVLGVGEKPNTSAIGRSIRMVRLALGTGRPLG